MLMDIANAGQSLRESVYSHNGGDGAFGGFGSSVGDVADKAKRLTSHKPLSDEERLMNAMRDDYVDSEHSVAVTGTDGADTIDICVNADKSYTVTVNGEQKHIDADAARRLVVDGGAGDDVITVRQEKNADGAEPAKRPDNPYADLGNKRAIFITGGAGNDTVAVSSEVNVSTYITGGKGDDVITGGSGNDVIVDNYGSNRIDGGAGCGD